MDTSEKYIKMCEQAREIQDIRKVKYSQSFKIIDYTDIMIDNIWLPRQDQLQEMIVDEIYGGSCFNMLMNFGLKLREEINYDMTSSAEQLWLSFIMKEKYRKIWNEETQKWLK